MGYIINGACKSVIGNIRENNEDNYYFNFKTLREENSGNTKTTTMQFENSDNIICSVFDGMGGETNGERASFLATSTLKEYLQKNVNQKFLWNNYINLANEKICKEMPKNLRMGTTLAGVQFLKDEISICNVGDSRVYGFKYGKLEQISRDHTEANLQEKLNINLGHKPRLTQHLGIRKEEMTLIPYEKQISYSKLDKMLLCSDGLTDMLTDEEIQEIMSKNLQTKEIVEQLIDKALANGGVDNITVIVLEIKKSKKTNHFKLASIVLGILAIIIAIAIIVKSNEFKIVKNDYAGPIIVGQSFEFEYKGNVKINLSNDNVKYDDGKITAVKEGTTTITIKDKKGNMLFNQTIKVFPK